MHHLSRRPRRPARPARAGSRRKRSSTASLAGTVRGNRDFASAPFGLARCRTCTCAPTVVQPSARESGSRCMSAPRSPSASTDPHARCPASKNHQELLAGTAAARQHRRRTARRSALRETASPPVPSAPGPGPRGTARSCPGSNPGGANRSHRGSDSRSATTCSTTLFLAQTRRNSHTAVSVALTVAPERSRPPRPGVTSMQVLETGQRRPG